MVKEMNERYYYSDIAEMEERFEAFSRQMETFIDDFISIGLNISGLQGETAKSVEERFSIHYRKLKKEQAACRKNTLDGIRLCREAFLEVDHENAVINIGMLEENDTYVTRILNEIEAEFIDYNQTLSRITHTGADLEYLPEELISGIREEQSGFIEKLIQKLYMADMIGSAAIQQCYADYEEIIVHLLIMFEADLQVQLTGLMSGKIPQAAMERIEEKLAVENEEKALRLYLESNKESIMSEFEMETEADWRFYMEGAFVTLSLLQEYQGQIEAFDQLSIDEKLEKYPLGTATPLSRYLFMVQLEGCSLDQRKTILSIFEEKGEITDQELSEVMGTEVGGLLDMRTTLLNSQYKASLMGQTLQEFTEEAKAYDQSRLTQYILFVATPMLLNYQIGSYNPSPSNASLNPSVRLDQIEIESQSGLKTYDYVPITPESLDRVKGLDKGVGKAKKVTINGKEYTAKPGPKVSGAEYKAPNADFYVAPNRKVLPGQYKDWLGTNMRDPLINSVETPTLKKAIGEVYRPGSVIGDGGTADIIRFERGTGILLSKSGHVQTGIDMSKYFQKLIDSGTLSNADAKVAQNILDGLKNALGGK